MSSADNTVPRDPPDSMDSAECAALGGQTADSIKIDDPIRDFLRSDPADAPLAHREDIQSTEKSSGAQEASEPAETPTSSADRADTPLTDARARDEGNQQPLLSTVPGADVIAPTQVDADRPPNASPNGQEDDAPAPSDLMPALKANDVPSDLREQRYRTGDFSSRGISGASDDPQSLTSLAAEGRTRFSEPMQQSEAKSVHLSETPESDAVSGGSDHDSGAEITATEAGDVLNPAPERPTVAESSRHTTVDTDGTNLVDSDQEGMPQSSPRWLWPSSGGAHEVNFQPSDAAAQFKTVEWTEDVRVAITELPEPLSEDERPADSPLPPFEGLEERDEAEEREGRLGRAFIEAAKSMEDVRDAGGDLGNIVATGMTLRNNRQEAPSVSLPPSSEAFESPDRPTLNPGDLVGNSIVIAVGTAVLIVKAWRLRRDT